ncbi:hypothetical protein [Marinibactrum halimedae]|uniref:hypothetical protein n=1 Tax=Marinibactrum halimedae TaxID=1444977 RepID=UPI001E648656|nr:hypothetical protein [Marinibactrum halimedae]MCD9459898.1 hypothetical protein [Marinibactrum halimedae]
MNKRAEFYACVTKVSLIIEIKPYLGGVWGSQLERFVVSGYFMPVCARLLMSFAAHRIQLPNSWVAIRPHYDKSGEYGLCLSVEEAFC